MRAVKPTDGCHSTADLRRLAMRCVPRAVFDYVDGAAEGEWTLARNSAAFESYCLIPRYLRDVSKTSIATRVLGAEIEMPVVLAPVAMNKLFHRDGECAVARAAGRAGTVFSLSAVGTASIEDVAAAGSGPKWFQIYVWRDRGLTNDFIDRCRAAGYQALMLTVDVPVAGKRERDLRNGMAVPPQLGLATLAEAVAHPRWCWSYLTQPGLRFANLEGRSAPAGRGSIMSYIDSQFDPSVDWSAAAAMIERWNGPFAIKGVLSAEDAIRAVEIGATGVIVSNHGGRQLDGAPATLEVLPEIVAAVGERVEVILDGGVRRGTDVLKALALGATACMVGRPYVYGLCAGGEAGVDRALAILADEIRRSLRLIGCSSLAELTLEHLRSIGAH